MRLLTVTEAFIIMNNEKGDQYNACPEKITTMLSMFDQWRERKKYRKTSSLTLKIR